MSRTAKQTVSNGQRKNGASSSKMNISGPAVTFENTDVNSNT